jgi:ATP-binding cassette subfamily B protein
MLIMVLNGLGTLVPSLVAQAFFNDLAHNVEANVLVYLLVLYFMLEVGRMSVVVVMRFAGTTLWHTVGGLLRLDLFAHILAQPGARALPASPGEAVSRFRDDVDEFMAFLGTGGIPAFVGISVYTVSSLSIMLRINTGITLLVLAPLAGVMLLAYLGRERITLYRTASRAATADVTGALGEMFGAVQAVKVATAEGRIIEHFESLNARRRSAALRDLLFTEVLNAFFNGLVGIGTGLVLLLAAQSIRAGAFTIGDFAFFAYNIGAIAYVIEICGSLLARGKQLQVSLERLEALLQGASLSGVLSHSARSLQGTIPAPSGADEELATLVARSLTYRYPDSGRGIEGISLRLRRGSFTVVTGRIGSGKTTLLRTVLGLLPKQGGEICWNGEIVGDPGAFFVPPRSAYTPQVPRLFSDTLSENILLGIPAGEGRPATAVYRAVLEEDVQLLAAGLDTVVGPRGVKLSGGQVQRAAAARMFVRNAELLVVDDLSSALDVETERLLWERLSSQSHGTYLVVSHRHAALSRADHIIVLKDGKLEAEGRLEQLLVECDEMQRLWGGEVPTETARQCH